MYPFLTLGEPVLPTTSKRTSLEVSKPHVGTEVAWRGTVRGFSEVFPPGLTPESLKAEATEQNSWRHELFIKRTLFRRLFYVSLEQSVTVSFSAWPCWTQEIQEAAQSPSSEEAHS